MNYQTAAMRGLSHFLWQSRHAVGLLLLVLIATETLWAGSGEVIHLPKPGKRIRNGVRMTLDTRWVDSNGYRPNKIEISTSTSGLSKSTRSFKIEITPHQSYSGRKGSGASVYLELPQGARSASTTISIPNTGYYHEIDVRVYEDDQLLDDLSGVYDSRGNYNTDELTPTMLFLDYDAPSQKLRRQRVNKYDGLGDAQKKKLVSKRDLPDYRGLICAANNYPVIEGDEYLNWLTSYKPSEPMGDDELLSHLREMPKTEILPPGETPKHWIGYTCFDFIFLSLDDLKRMKTQHAEQWGAVRDWLASGPILCVYDLGENFERLAELERLLELSPLVADTEAADSASSPPEKNAYLGWKQPKLIDRTINNKALSTQRNYNRSFNYGVQRVVPPSQIQVENEKKAEKPEKPAANSKQIPFVWRKAELGTLVAIGSENPFPGERKQWNWIFNSLSTTDWLWYRRHGFSPERNNSDFWNFLVPGTGRSPVGSFLILISLFVIIIGPVNYAFLRRKGRLYLILVTVPLGAGIITTCLFTYAIVTDGLEMRTRVRSFTLIDQTTSRSASWSRQTYYAGLAPSQGLDFPLDTAVYSLEYFPPNSYQGNETYRRIDWDQSQRLAAGYISSRTTSQFLVIRSRETEARLKVVASENPGKPPQATNHLQTDIHKLLLCGLQGNLYLADETANGANLKLKPCTLAEARMAFSEIYDQKLPQFPEKYDPNMHTNIWESFSYGRYRNNNDPDNPRMATSILENYLQVLKHLKGPVIKPGGYLAIVEFSPEVPLGVESTKHEDSLHVIMGKW